MLDFRPSFVNYCPSNLLCGSPPPHLPKVKVQYVCGWVGFGGGVVLSCVGDHILPEFNAVFLTRFRTYKNVSPMREGVGGGGCWNLIGRIFTVLGSGAFLTPGSGIRDG
jgi:hypothetical protein